jgi:hypothetical protein
MSGTVLLFVLITIHWILDLLKAGIFSKQLVNDTDSFKVNISGDGFLDITGIVNPTLLGFEFLVLDALLVRLHQSVHLSSFLNFCCRYTGCSLCGIGPLQS